MEDLRFRWNGSEFKEVSGSPAIPLLVADSFLVQNGAAVGIQEHAERFISSAAEQGLVNSVEDFYFRALALIPQSGMFFPRLDVTERGELEILIRKAPPIKERAIVMSAPQDPRTQPGIKGPDIPALNDLRGNAHVAGADEAIILSNKGAIIDGATSAVLWGMDGEWFIPSTSLVRVHSTTLQQVQKFMDNPLKEATISPTDLEGQEVYVLNALHGIRAVTQWIGVPTLAVNHDRLLAWRNDYSRLFTQITEA